MLLSGVMMVAAGKYEITAFFSFKIFNISLKSSYFSCILLLHPRNGMDVVRSAKVLSVDYYSFEDSVSEVSFATVLPIVYFIFTFQSREYFEELNCIMF